MPPSPSAVVYIRHIEKILLVFYVNLIHKEYIHTRKIINSEEGILIFVVVNVINVMTFD